jgi:hypothetical protein
MSAMILDLRKPPAPLVNPRRLIGKVVKLKNGREGMVIAQSYATRADWICRMDVRIGNQTYEVREDEIV